MAERQRADVTFRERPSGGSVLETPELTERAKYARRRTVFLVHGFNVSESSMAKQYAYFQAEMTRQSSLLADDLFTVSWPGDADLLPKVKTLAYGPMVSKAVETGQYFGARLLDMRAPNGGPCEIAIIAHSLGCRMVLEAIDIARRSPSPNRYLLFLMAPAVAGELVIDGGRLRDAVLSADTRFLFFSENDEALGWAFRLGQHMSQDPRPLHDPRAVGKTGLPERFLWYPDQQHTALKHNACWDSDLVINPIAETLGVVRAKSRWKRPAPDHPSLSQAELQRILPAWQLPSWGDHGH